MEGDRQLGGQSVLSGFPTRFSGVAGHLRHPGSPPFPKASSALFASSSCCTLLSHLPRTGQVGGVRSWVGIGQAAP